MTLYADTSLLVSYYIPDANTANAQALLGALNDPLPFTGLHRLEMRNAFALGVFRRLFGPSQVSAAWRNVERDLRSGRLIPEAVNWPPIYRRAARMAAQHCQVLGCRSLDVLHVSAAEHLRAR
jgi:hypothetical protein